MLFWQLSWQYMPDSRLSQHPAGVLGSALDWKTSPNDESSLLFDWPSTQTEEQGLLAGHLKSRVSLIMGQLKKFKHFQQ